MTAAFLSEGKPLKPRRIFKPALFPHVHAAADKWRETEAGRVTEWQESRNIEQDPVAREKWLKRELASADEKWQKRERRLARQRELGVIKQSNGEESTANRVAEKAPTSGVI